MQLNPYMNPYQPHYPMNNGIIWVQGIEGAKAWQLSPNSNVLLMDSENEGKFYIKVSDSAGMCSLRMFTYKEITNTPTDMSQYVTRAELQELLGGLLNGKQSLSAIESDAETGK